MFCWKKIKRGGRGGGRGSGCWKGLSCSTMKRRERLYWRRRKTFGKGGGIGGVERGER